jgi:hypothetical protein
VIVGAKDPSDKYELIRIRRYAEAALKVINDSPEIVRAKREERDKAAKEAGETDATQGANGDGEEEENQER